MRISDWSSDVCSSDLIEHVGDTAPLELHLQRFAVIAFTMTRLARHIDVGQEVHLDLDKSVAGAGFTPRSEEHTSELQSLMRISYAVFCLKKKSINITKNK